MAAVTVTEWAQWSRQDQLIVGDVLGDPSGSA
jgi:hypothetical protein